MSPKFRAVTDLYSDPGLVDEVKRMLDDVRQHDGVEALGEAFVRGIGEDAGHRHIIAVDGDDHGSVMGILAIDPQHVAELAVHPDFRHQRLAWKLLDNARSLLALKGAIDVWAHGDLAPAQAFVASLDARRTRELLKMAVELKPGSQRNDDIRQAAVSAKKHAEQQDCTVLNLKESYERFGKDFVDEEWVRVNNEAFAWHPEQGGWDMATLYEARDVAWFDPAGVWFIWRTKDDEESAECLGFHWTKIPMEEKRRDDGERTGEVYVVCLADAARGQGLGRAITLIGMDSLLRDGCDVIELYVEGDNAPAVATYRRLGFDVVHTDVVYRGVL